LAEPFEGARKLAADVDFVLTDKSEKINGERFAVYGIKINAGWVFAGRDANWVLDTQEILFQAIAWELGTAIGVAFTLARRNERRIARISVTLDAVLRIAQLEGGQVTLGKDPIDLSEVVSDIFDLLAPVFEDAGHVITGRFPPTPVLILGDRDILDQAFQNLIRNAIHRRPTQAKLTYQYQQLVATQLPTFSMVDLNSRR
tara:strand:- start:1325 stop:1927 length:603 start_codon:yes stop_codon:yes gene_type:complete